jgi:LysM repeat protein
MRRTAVAMSLVLCASVVGAQQPVNPPPRPLHKVEGHWTPYQPPTEFPADAQVYTIKPGDTLWELAHRFLGDPYLWPQLWEKNQYIRDAHWIYPGDPLVVGTKAEEMAPAQPAAPEATPPPGAEGTPSPGQGEGTAPPGGPSSQPAGPAGQLMAIGTESDVYCFGYLDETSEQMPVSVASAEHLGLKELFVQGDVIFFNGGTEEGIEAGKDYFLVLPGKEVRHPATGALLGRFMQYVGHARVLCAQDHSATAEITASCDGVPIGAKVRPFEAIPIPMTVMTPPLTICEPESGKPTGYITYAKDGYYHFGKDETVMLDLGAADQVAPGTVLTIFRANPVVGMPRLVLGEVGVLTAGDHWSTAKVLSSKEAIEVGDRVEVK